MDASTRRCNIVLRQQVLDTTTPAGKAMFQMMGVFAEFKRAMIQERVRAGLARARGEGKRLGRPPRKFAYDVWGDAVNIAARLEAASQPNRVLASAATVKALGSQYRFDGPQKIDTKEGRVLEAFFVSCPLDDAPHLKITKINQPRPEAIKAND
jgi:class 3 adenylate cyclase